MESSKKTPFQQARDSQENKNLIKNILSSLWGDSLNSTKASSILEDYKKLKSPIFAITKEELLTLAKNLKIKKTKWINIGDVVFSLKKLTSEDFISPELPKVTAIPRDKPSLPTPPKKESKETIETKPTTIKTWSTKIKTPDSQEDFWNKLNRVAEEKWYHKVPEAAILENVSAGKKLESSAAKNFKLMRTAAKGDWITLQVRSAFRSVEDQKYIIEKKAAKWLTLDQILSFSAPPGYSEHHSGKAVDIITPDCPALEQKFENTEAFVWLQRNASTYWFNLSYPKNSSNGAQYEPWHWHYSGAQHTT